MNIWDEGEEPIGRELDGQRPGNLKKTIQKDKMQLLKKTKELPNLVKNLIISQMEISQELLEIQSDTVLDTKEAPAINKSPINRCEGRNLNLFMVNHSFKRCSLRL